MRDAVAAAAAKMHLLGTSELLMEYSIKSGISKQSDDMKFAIAKALYSTRLTSSSEVRKYYCLLNCA